MLLPGFATACGLLLGCDQHSVECIPTTQRQVGAFPVGVGPFPSEDAALKVMYLALRNLSRKWQVVQGWKEAINRFALLWEDRFPH
jgi:hypothetical protein